MRRRYFTLQVASVATALLLISLSGAAASVQRTVLAELYTASW